ncbi:hypothetical protein [Paenibacillus lautus]|jgi:hypothetical protein|uniref:hypothetical protein n=1 Tax=Paenibacillus lautus TaxID=1401 RepID=UPI000FD7D829|nr:hypothetical protein [Paenibacillus lautus]
MDINTSDNSVTGLERWTTGPHTGLELEVIPQVADCRIFTILGSQLLDNIIISQEDKPVLLDIS